MTSVRSLLSEIIDYAGLFPPARHDLLSAAQNFARYRASDQSWMLGRFVVPAALIAELDGLGRDLDGYSEWRLSAVAGEDFEADFKLIAARNASGVGAVVDMVEVKANTIETIRRIARAVPDRCGVYVEIPTDDDQVRDLVASLSENRLRAKIRTGGITLDAFPPPGDVARFIRCCYARALPFKATAGLHHPLRSEHPLTFDAGAVRGDMHGFLNVFLTAAFCYNGLGAADARRSMEVEDPNEFIFDNDMVQWGNYVLSSGEIASIRKRFAVSFGSCSFQEPVEDLQNIELL